MTIRSKRWRDSVPGVFGLLLTGWVSGCVSDGKPAATAPEGAAVAAPTGPVALQLIPPKQTERTRASFVATGQHAMVAAAHPLASDAGLKILKDGGNAYDAAVAVSFALGVVRPQSTGIGGGGFMVAYVAAEKTSVVYDFRERAPKAATKDMYLDAKGNSKPWVVNGASIPDASVNGPLAVAVPGLVAGLVEVQKKYGKLTLAQVMAPAIDLAEHGFPVYPSLAEALKERGDLLAKFPSSAKIYLVNGQPLKLGDLLVQKDMAWTLRQIAKHGADAFYKGEIAHKIVAEMQRDHGLVTLADLKHYQVRQRQPVIGTYRGHKIVSMPPPSSGGVHVVEILNILAGDDYGKLGAGSLQATHLLAEAMRRAFADRARYLGDPEYTKVPLAGLLSPAYGLELRKSIDPTKATPSDKLPPGQPTAFEHPETSHLSVVDQWGNAVSATETVNFAFGSGVVAAGTGVMLNDEMDDFSKKAGAPNVFGLVGADANSVAAGKTPLSSMSPTLVFDAAGKLELVVGSPGGPRIISATVQTIINRLDFHMSLPDAVHAGRIHHQWLPDVLRVEKNGMDPGVAQQLTQMGYTLQERGTVGDVQAVAVEGANLIGVSDTRSEGAPRGF